MKGARWRVVLILINESEMDTWQGKPCSDCGPGISPSEDGACWDLVWSALLSGQISRMIQSWSQLIHTATLIDRWLLVIMFHRFLRNPPSVHLIDPLGDPRTPCNTMELGWIYLLPASCRNCGSLGGIANGPGWCFFKCSACPRLHLQATVIVCIQKEQCYSGFKKNSAILDSSTSNLNLATLNTQITKIGVFPNKEVNFWVHKIISDLSKTNWRLKLQWTNKTQKLPLTNDFQNLFKFSPEFISNSHTFDRHRLEDLELGRPGFKTLCFHILIWDIEQIILPV